jgi:hypothetical protein
MWSWMLCDAVGSGLVVRPRSVVCLSRDPPLDYYLIFSAAADRERGMRPSGILVEEFC